MDGFWGSRSYGSTAFRAGYLGIKHPTTELRPFSLIDDKSRHFPCQRGPGLVLLQALLALDRLKGLVRFRRQLNADCVAGRDLASG